MVSHATPSTVFPVYVSFTIAQAHAAGPITWGVGCVNPGVGSNAAYAMVNTGTTCIAAVAVSAQTSRFCASTVSAPANGYTAQQDHLTMIETNFVKPAPYVCSININRVFYDISLILSTCTDEEWKTNQCAGVGGASYNLPVQLSCQNQPTYTCQAPTSAAYGQ